MGGGNGQKAQMASEKNLEKQKAAKVCQLDSNKKAMSIQAIRKKKKKDDEKKISLSKGLLLGTRVEVEELRNQLHQLLAERRTTHPSSSPHDDEVENPF